MEFKLICLSGAILLFVLCLSAPASSCLASPADFAGLPGVSAPMLRPEFWIARAASPQRVMLTPAEIGSFNRAINARMPQTVIDWDRFPDSVDGATLRRWLAADRMPRGAERYSDGERLTSAFYDQLEQNMNLAGLKDNAPVIWGFTVRRSDLRTFPTAEASSEDDESDEFDLFQETAVNIAEPVAVLHRSADRAWVFVQTYNYRGWLKEADVALSPTRLAWRTKLEPAAFLVITGSKVVPRESAGGKPVADWRAGMGTRLILLGMEQDGYAVELPQRDATGAVKWRRAWIHGKADVTAGYLPYTQANVIRQAFKMLGERYGWGGLQDGRDCSSFIMDIFRVFGIRGPRNADQQENVPGRHVELRGAASMAARYELLQRAEPGATLHMRNHVMLYLGQENGLHYAIHSLGGYGDASRPRADGTLPRIETMRVVVGGLDVPLQSGRRFVEALSSFNVWHP